MAAISGPAFGDPAFGDPMFGDPTFGASSPGVDGALHVGDLTDAVGDRRTLDRRAVVGPRIVDERSPNL